MKACGKFVEHFKSFKNMFKILKKISYSIYNRFYSFKAHKNQLVISKYKSFFRYFYSYFCLFILENFYTSSTTRKQSKKVLKL